MSAHPDLIVIGAGPGGYVCALRAAQLGLRVLLVDKRPTLGGTCLNVGCIPSKALLHSTELIQTVRQHGPRHGLRTGPVEIDLAALLERKDTVVNRLVKGIGQLCQARQIEVVQGTARLLGNGAVAITGPGGEVTRQAGHIVLAPGSLPAALPGLPFDGQTIVSSDQAIAFPTVPPRLAVIGGGAIGLELGSVWSRLGSQVTILEFLPRVAPGFDDDIRLLLERLFKRQGLRLETGLKVTGGTARPDGFCLTAERDGQPLEFSADKVLVAVGRLPATRDLGLEAAGVQCDARGRILIDRQFHTSAPNVLAIGDAVPGPMLAHKAEEEGVAAAELLAGHAGAVNYDVIPSVIYTSPEAAICGLGEQAAKARGLSIKIGKFPLSANGRAIASDATDGLVKLVADATSDRLLGAQIVAHQASELIAIAVAHLEYGGSAEDLARTIHPHPTLSESLKEAALALSGHPLHSL